MEACKRCNGAGWYHYDENHATGCPDCCGHPAELRYRQGEHHPHPGVETCAHCGTEFRARQPAPEGE